MKKKYTFFLLFFTWNILAQVSVPPCPLPGNSHANAPLLDCCLDGYTYGTTGPGGVDAPADFCHTVENGQWLAFQVKRGVSEMTFGLEVSNCGNADGLEMQVFGIGNGCSIDSLFAVSGCVEVTGAGSVTATGLIPGHVYYILLDGISGDVCEYTISLLDELVSCDAPQPYIDGPTAVNAGQSATYTVVVPPDTCFFEIHNPCGNIKQDTLTCAGSCDTMAPAFNWTGPPGSTVVHSADGYAAQVTFGTESGLVCADIEEDCFHFSGCIPVHVCQPFNVNVGGGNLITDCTPAQLTVFGNYVSYLWSTGATSPTVAIWIPGLYSVQVTDQNGCEATSMIWVEAIPGTTVSISGPNTVCPEGTVSLTVNASNIILSYNWNTGATGATLPAVGPGTYSVTVMDIHGCLYFANRTVTALPSPNVSIQSSTGNTLPAGGTSVLDAGSGFTTYLWSDGTAGQTITAHAAGIYSVTVTNAFDCAGSATLELVEATNDLCTQYDYPAPPGDSCHSAPLFCGENINGFCSNNGGYAADTTLFALFGCSLENTQWLRFVPCETEVDLTFVLGPCTNADGLELGIFTTDDCENFTAVQTCLPLLPNTANAVNIGGLVPGEVYYLILDGINGDACDYRIELVSGISTEPAVWELVSDGYIEGPDTVCVGEPASYTLVPPVCELVSGSTGCPLPVDIDICPSGPDSVAIIWHIPAGAIFIGDSVNVLTITIIWDSLPPPGNDSIGVEFQYFYDTTFTSLVFCGCEGACGGNIDGKTVTVIFNVVELTANLSCPDPSMEFCGETITGEGVYYCSIDCGLEILTVTVDLTGEFIDLGTVELCIGECFNLQGNLYCDPGSYTEFIFHPVTGCTDTYTFHINILFSPPLTTGPVTALCDATGQFYTVGFSIFGGMPPYYVNGAPIVGNFYQSSSIPNGQSYSFQIWSGDVCGNSTMVGGIWECPCPNESGTVVTALQYVCEPVSVQFIQPPQLGPNDLLLFVLHHGDGTTLVNPLVTNATGIFGFIPGTMQYGQTYYISPVTGPDNGSGYISLNSFCTQVAAGQPVVFYEKPAAAIPPPDTLNCLLTSLTLESMVTGGSNSLEYVWNGPDGFVFDETYLTIANPGIYQLVVTDALTGCSASASVVVTADVEHPDLHATGGGELTCLEPTALLSAISQKPGVDFTWTLPDGNTVLGTSMTVQEAGVYAVVATANNGCTASASVTVTGTSDVHLLVNLATEPPTCFEDTDGFIQIAGVSGGEEPYSLTLSGASVPVNGMVEDLPAGYYLLKVVDAKGCQLDTLIHLPQPTLVLVQLEPEIHLRLGQPLYLGFQSTVAPASILWSGPNGQTWQDVPTVELLPMEGGTYRVVVADANACSASAEVRVFVEKGEVFVPSAFSPDGNGINDAFTVFAGPGVRLVRSFTVFDRWGEKVFEGKNFAPNDPSLGWDGTIRGHKAKPAVFIYWAEVEFINGETKVVSGDTVLLR